MCKILSRIQEISKAEGITIASIERTIGASRGVISKAIAKGTDIQSKWIEKICENYPKYSAQWLITGQGEMIQEKCQTFTDIDDSKKIISPDNEYNSSVKILTEIAKKKHNAIPLVTERAVGGFANEHFSIHDDDVLAYYVIPKFRSLNVDFMIEVIGDSMIPKIYPGDIIACSILHNPSFIQWNKPYLLATRDNGLIVKRIHKCDNDNFLVAVSDNKDYAPFDIPKDDIFGIARIVGVLHLE